MRQYTCHNCGGLAPLKTRVFLTVVNNGLFAWCPRCESWQDFHGVKS